MKDWRYRATAFGNCNCSYGCPCQFNALPTHGDCRAAGGMQIEQGHFGTTLLDGLRVVWFFSFPGAMHEGNGTIQFVIDEGASAEQREALRKILSGEDTEEMGSIWYIMGLICPNKLDTLYLPIEFEANIETRRGHISVPGLIEVSAEPIRNPVTGAEHRVRIDMPEGFEFRFAEMASGRTTANTQIALPGLDQTYAQFCITSIAIKGCGNKGGWKGGDIAAHYLGDPRTGPNHPRGGRGYEKMVSAGDALMFGGRMRHHAGAWD